MLSVLIVIAVIIIFALLTVFLMILVEDPDFSDTSDHIQTCMFCGKEISSGELVCDDCKKKMSDQIS